MILCDWAEAVNGKLYSQGGGWTHLLLGGNNPAADMAVGLVVAVPWDETNKRHPLELRLMTDDGEQVMVGDQEVMGAGNIEVGRPAGIKPGSDLNAVVAFKFQGVPLEPGGYVWQLTIDDEPRGRTPFWVVTR